jgi:hypothetical protein
MASVVITINLLLVLILYKEPKREKITEPLGRSLATIFRNIYLALSDMKLLIFLVIIIGFWTMYNQLFYTLPVFIDQWVDTSPLYEFLAGLSPRLASAIGTPEKNIAPEMIVNIDALYIVLFQVLISGFVIRFKPLNTMATGFLICAIGIGLWFISLNPFYLFLSILIFAIGEMTSSPKILEYIGKIAPEDKVALYMGCYFIPLAGGNFFAGILSGNVYAAISDKITLLQKEVAARGLEIPSVSGTFTQNDYVNQACDMMGMNHSELTLYLWETYHPYNIWWIFTGIGLLTVVALYVYSLVVFRKDN